MGLMSFELYSEFIIKNQLFNVNHNYRSLMVMLDLKWLHGSEDTPGNDVIKHKTVDYVLRMCMNKKLLSIWMSVETLYHFTSVHHRSTHTQSQNK